jgi:hypothetical protein
MKKIPGCTLLGARILVPRRAKGHPRGIALSGGQLPVYIIYKDRASGDLLRRSSPPSVRAQATGNKISVIRFSSGVLFRSFA